MGRDDRDSGASEGDGSGTVVPTNTAPRPFRILSIDGGGIRGAYPAAVIAHWEERLGTPITEHVDLIAGTSTGGILALGLAAGFPAARLVEIYEQRGREIFGRPRRLRSWLRGPRHTDARLKAVVRDLVGERRMDELKTPVCICTVVLPTGLPKVLKSPHHPRLEVDGRMPVWQAALATSAAPTYLPPAAGEDGRWFLDGGIWANSPTVVGITEAVAYFDRSLEDIRMISVGTGESPAAWRGQRMKNWGTVRWARSLFDLLVSAQGQAGRYTARLLLGDERMLRVDTPLPESLTSLDDPEIPETLIPMGAEAGQRSYDEFVRLTAE